MLNKCKINRLAVTSQVGHFCKTAVVFGQVPDFHVSHKIITKPYSIEVKKTNKGNFFQHRQIIIIILISTLPLLHGLHGFLYMSDS